MENSFEDSQSFGNDLKVILLGNVSSGKTSIVERYINNIFQEKIRATISPNFAYKLIKKNNIIYKNKLTTFITLIICFFYIS